MSEILKTISEATKDIWILVVSFGGFCTAISIVIATISVRRRWRIQRHLRNYSNYLWPGEKYRCRSSALMVMWYLLVIAAAFMTTFILASIAAATLALAILRCRDVFYVAIFLTAIIISGCAGALSQYSTEWFENALLEFIEDASLYHRQKQHRRSKLLRRRRYSAARRSLAS